MSLNIDLMVVATAENATERKDILTRLRCGFDEESLATCFCPFSADDHGHMDPEALRAARSDPDDYHQPMTALLTLENDDWLKAYRWPWKKGEEEASTPEAADTQESLA